MKKLVALIAALVMVAGYAYAGDWDFYGSSRVQTFITDTDNPTTFDTKSLSETLQSTSRIGAKVKVNDELTGGFEYGPAVNVRKLYGEWNFGAGSFLVGQTYTPLNLFYSNQVYGDDEDLLDIGGVYSGRQAMLQLKFGDFKIALTTPTASTLNTAGYTAEVDFTAVEASYTLAVNDNFKIDLGGGWQSYELTNGTSTYDVDAYVVAAGARASMGMVYANASIFSGQNAGALIAISVDGDGTFGGDGLPTTSGTTVLDNDCLGYLLVVGMKINDMFTVEAGYGAVSTDLDGNNPDDDASSYYANVTVNLAPGVFFVPEIGKIDGDETGDKELTYYGVKWQINF